MNNIARGLVGAHDPQYDVAAKVLAAEHNPTVEENIDHRIYVLKMELARLEQSKIDLQPLLKMRIRDIRSAMDY